MTIPEKFTGEERNGCKIGVELMRSGRRLVEEKKTPRGFVHEPHRDEENIIGPKNSHRFSPRIKLAIRLATKALLS
jgi:hypothetical protein